jgi:hypothetical protein
MFRWWKKHKARQAYRSQTLRELGIITMPRGESVRASWVKSLLTICPQLETGIRNSFEQGYKSEQIAVLLALSLLSEDIKQKTDTERENIMEGLQQSQSSPDYLQHLRESEARHIAAGGTFPENIDPLQWRLQCALLRVYDLYHQHNIDEFTKNAFVSDIIGALRGETPEERASARWEILLDNHIRTT